MPGLQSASISAKLLRELGGESVMGPYMLGLEHPVQIAPMTASASDLVMLAVLAGGSDALGDINRQSVQMSSEMILTRAPEVIIELHYGDTLKNLNRDAERRVWNAVPAVPAVKNNRIYLLGGDEFVVPGPRIVLAAERFADVLHPR